MIKKRGLGRGLDALLGTSDRQQDDEVAAVVRHQSRRNRGRSDSSRSVSAASQHSRRGHRGTGGVDQGARRHATDRVATSCHRRLRNHRRRTPLARRATRRSRSHSRGHQGSQRRTRRCDGADREHSTRRSESARRGARVAALVGRVPSDAAAGRGCGRQVARRRDEPAASVESRRAGSRDARRRRTRNGTRARACCRCRRSSRSKRRVRWLRKAFRFDRPKRSCDSGCVPRR